MFAFDGNGTQDGDHAQFKVTLTKDDLLWNMGGECVVKIQGLTIPGHVWLLGDVFLRKAYLVHDTEKLQVTFFPVAEASTAILALGQGQSTGYKTLLFLVVPAAAILVFVFKLRRGTRQARSTTGPHPDLSQTSYIRLWA